MVDPNWGLLQQADVGGALQAGIAAGQNERRQRETDNALAAFSQNPGDPNAVNALMRYNPQLGLKVMEQQQERQNVLAKRAEADHKALVDWTGQAALDVLSRPEAEQPAAWDAYVTQIAREHPDAAAQRGRYSKETALALIAQAGLTERYQSMMQPKTVPTQQGGGVFNVYRDGRVETLIQPNPGDKPMGAPVEAAPPPSSAGEPDWLADFAPEEIQQMRGLAEQRRAKRNIPSGSPLSGGPSAGQVVDGYRFLGGDPNQKANWEQVQ